MANRTLYPNQAFGSSRIYMDFGFLTNNTASPNLSSLKGVGLDAVASLSRTGVGVIVVTLKDSFSQCVKFDATLDDTANDGAYATIGNMTNEGTSSGLQFTIRTRSAAGTLTDYAARYCAVTLALRNGNWGVR